MGRRAIEFDNHQVQNFLSRHSEDDLCKKHPKIDSIIGDTIKLQLPRKLACSTLLRILRECPVIAVHAAVEATEHRYARSTISEYAMLARVASEGIAGYISTNERRRKPERVSQGRVARLPRAAAPLDECRGYRR